ncbi:MAG: hypothetical protein GY811_12550 [Myxococcales bacterium]|nr:hypothetical protein [Myxococcales bacterium]
MKKLQNYIPLSMLVMGAFASQTGCVDAADPLLILRNQAPGDSCTISDDVSADHLSSGRIDVLQIDEVDGYLFTPLVENRAVWSERADRLAFFEAAVVRLKFADDFFSAGELSTLKADGLSHFTQPFSGSIAAEGQSHFIFEIIPKAMLEEMEGKLADDDSTRVTAEIEIRGSIEGSDVSSPTFTYPIVVCKGCLTNVLGACDELSDEEIRPGGSCQIHQDGYVDCCTSDDGLECPAVAPVVAPVEE